MDECARLRFVHLADRITNVLRSLGDSLLGHDANACIPAGVAEALEVARANQRLLDKDTDTAAKEVRDKVNSVLPLLPKTIQQPRVDKFDPDAAPVLSVAVSAGKPVREITEYADKVLRRQIESVTGVGQVLIIGHYPWHSVTEEPMTAPTDEELQTVWSAEVFK